MATNTATALTALEEERLIRKAQAGGERATAELLKAHEPVLKKIVDRFPQTAVADRDDLLQEARMGFLTALAEFDPERGSRLVTNVYREASKAVAEAAAQGGAIAIPGRTLRRYLAAWGSTDDYSEALAAATSGEHPMSPETFSSVHAAVHGVVSLDSTVNDEGRSLHEVIAAPSTGGGYSDAARALVAELPEAHRQVIVLAFGLDGEDPMIDSEIAKRLPGMSRQKVQRLRTAALTIMRGGE